MGPIPRSSNQNVYMLVFVFVVELFVLRRATARTISNILTKEILTHWGVPNYILSDQGFQFLKQKLTTDYHSQTNLKERVHRTLKTMVVGTQHKHCDKHLHEF